MVGVGIMGRPAVAVESLRQHRQRGRSCSGRSGPGSLIWRFALQRGAALFRCVKEGWRLFARARSRRSTASRNAAGTDPV
jgi:hypothetical protein